MGAVFLLSLEWPECPYLSEGMFLHMSGALVFMSGALMLVAVTEGMSLECLAVVASGACVPESTGLQQSEREFSAVCHT